MNRVIVCMSVMLLSFACVQGALAHCQVPCGIYGDENRFAVMNEHITTIEKAMSQIKALSGEGKVVNYNQVVRWITTKETHADEIQHIVSQYFLTQRVKLVSAEAGPDHEAYVTKLKLLHEISVYAMKCKQTTDQANAAKLKAAVKAFKAAYFGK